MNRRHALAALASTLGAGCLRLTGGDDSTASPRPTTSATRTATRTPTDSPTRTPTDSPTETPTETATETESPTPAEPSFPEGLTEEGVRDFLFPFYLSTLGATSFSVEWSKLDRDQSEFKWRKQYDVGVGQAVGRATTRGMGGPADVYRSRTNGCLWRENLGGGYTYGKDSVGWSIEQMTWAEEIKPLFEAGNWGPPTRVNDTRPAVWEVSTETFADGSEAPGYLDDTLNSLTATMQIDQRGIIRSVNAAYQVTDPDTGRKQNFTTDFTISDVGSTTVSKPSWVSTAARKRPTVSAELTDDRRFIRFRIDSGNPLEPKSFVSVFTGQAPGAYDMRLDSRISPNSDVYLYQTGDPDELPSLGLARGRRPTSVSPPPFEGEIDLFARRAVLGYFKKDNL